MTDPQVAILMLCLFILLVLLLKDGAMLDASGLRAHFCTRLAAFKVPKYIWFLAEPLPRNANGKFLKRELREVLDPASAD